MAYVMIKIFISAVVIAAVSEISKRFAGIGALLLSLPLTSILAISWLYFDTRDATAAAVLSIDTLLMIVPSFVFFLAFYFLVRAGLGFIPSMLASCVTMALGYWAYTVALAKIGIVL